MDHLQREFAEFLLARNVVVPQEVVLNSGRVSKYNFDLRRIYRCRDIVDLDQYFGKFVMSIRALRGPTGFNNFNYTVIHGASGSGALLARGLANDFGRSVPNMFFSYGRKQGYFEGYPLKKGDKVLLVDDVLSTGETLETEADRLLKKEVNLQGIVVVFDRKEMTGVRYAIENLETKFRVKVYPFLTVDDFLEILPEDDIRRRMMVEQQDVYGIKIYDFKPLYNHELDEPTRDIVNGLLVVDNLSREKILSVVSRRTQVSKAEILGSSREAPIARARQIAMYLLREKGRMSFPEIGLYLKKHHSTVISGCRKIARILSNEPADHQPQSRLLGGYPL